MDTRPVPEPFESELAKLLDGSVDELQSGIARLCERYPDRANIIRRTADAVRADAGDVKPGDRIGPYAVLELIGHGGMGSVYLAEQREPVRRRVALKVIKLGMDTRAVLARFEAERQALALMDHPHIAKVFEAGATPTGRPYFAMEYVKGIPITRYCDENKLSLDDRLLLFKQLCHGVQHAHTKGVIHRDLTPSNVLVALQDGKPAAKIIDFGLARATDHKLTEKTLFTEQGVILGTPEYMSPEQAGLSALDIDMRSDVYTLGVVLYELLTGKLPFEGKDLRRAGYDAMCKTIREQDPPKPSTRVTKIEGGTTVAAKLRRTDAGTLLRRLRGDLDWIVLRCLEKDRTRRYETASELAADVQRHLDDEPVSAHAPSAGYRLAKFTRRYRIELGVAGLVLAAVLAGLAGTTTFWLEAKAQAKLAVEQAAEARRQEGIAQEQARAADAARAGEAAKAKEAAENAAAARRNAAEAKRQEGLAREQALAAEAARASEATRAKEAADNAMESRRNAAEAKRQEGIARRQAQAAELARASEAARATEAAENAATAQRNAERAWRSEERLAAKALEFDQLAGLAHLDRLLTELDRLSVPWSDLTAPRRWRAEADRVLAMRNDLSGTVADLQRRLVSAASTEPEQDGRVLGPGAGDQAQRVLCDALVALLARLEAFEANEVRALLSRLRCAEASLDHPRAQVTWQQAREAIVRADGVVASSLYKAAPIDLQPQLGLVPMGMNPVTKLWEFYSLDSARGRSDPNSQQIPTHDPDGRVPVYDGAGITFVLLPGATFTMGTQRDDRTRPNYDPDASPRAATRVVSVPAFFLARHELTVGQWERLGGARTRNGRYSYPITNLDWTSCARRLRAWGLTLPTGEQWEYGCRAGTSTPWWTGETEESVAEEFGEQLPVGSLRANPFGLFDVHGNVAEWTWDGQPFRTATAEYSIHAAASVQASGLGPKHDLEAELRREFEASLDALVRGYAAMTNSDDSRLRPGADATPRTDEAPTERIFRGGDMPRRATSASLNRLVAWQGSPDLGVRAARVVTDQRRDSQPR